MKAMAIRLRGVVQGVGFRPYIWRLAKQHQLQGSVWNDEQGVMIHVHGKAEQLQVFLAEIPKQLPPLAKLESIESREISQPEPQPSGFHIHHSSQSHAAQTPVSADAATCPQCLKEIRDPLNRHYRYPFTNCTHCGPRMSIVRAVPYDRSNTAMHKFTLCPQCRRDYENPANRRFHAQTICCPACGPTVWLEDQQGIKQTGQDPLRYAVALLQQGFILAIKGLGGFHLVCDAGNEQAVALLRQRKRRYAKPFALMAKDLEMIAEYTSVNETEKHLLQSRQAPIVLLSKKGRKLANSVAPNDRQLGFMLPYTPLHSLLMQEMQRPLVFTSGNLSEEPQCIDNVQARQKLATITDYLLLHNREIVNRLDDSVVRVAAGKPQILRRARGYAPEALKLPNGFEKADNCLAMGGELKNSFALLKQGQAIVSQHIGDLEDAATQQDYRNNIALYQHLFDFKPKKLSVDYHPAYLSTQYAVQWAEQQTLQCHRVQHHHAHIAACLAEHQIPLNTPPVLAAVFDGLGMGLNGELWGGEFMLADYRLCTRLASMQAIAMPGGAQAIREPWRNAYAQLRYYFDWRALQQNYQDLAFFKTLKQKPLNTLDTMIDNGLNSPVCSSVGRWFDAFAAILGIVEERVSYEGQAAIALENCAATQFQAQQAYPDSYVLQANNGMQVITWQALWQQVLDDLLQQVSIPIIAARIQHSLTKLCVELLTQQSTQHQTDTIVLSGGVFQNRLLLESVSKQLTDNGKQVLIAAQFPVNDGGLALGQLVIAAAE